MLAKCANPACSAIFHYFHEGKLFAIESRATSLAGSPPADREYRGNHNSPQYYWLCSSCCHALTVQPNGDHGISLVHTETMPRTTSGKEQDTLMAA